MPRSAFPLLPLVLPTAARAQQLLDYVLPPEADARIGWSLANAGDLDQDGVPDLAVGSATALVGPVVKGALHLVSGGTGQVLWRVDGREDDERFGARVAGVGDLLQEVSPYEPYRFFGTSLSATGDLNGDGVPDYAVGAYLGQGLVEAPCRPFCSGWPGWMKMG